MNEVTRAKRYLLKLGLSEKQSDIYLLLLTRSEKVRISDIVQALGIPRSSVYENLRALFEKGLAEEVIENSYRLIKAYPVSVLGIQLDEKAKELQNQADDLKILEKALEVLPGTTDSPATIVRYYKDRSGARQLFWNSLKAKDTVYVYSEWGRGRYLGMDFYKRFVEQSHKRKITEKVITNSTRSVLNSVREHANTSVSRTAISDIRCMKESAIKFQGETLIYGNTYAHVFLKNHEINGFEIESKQFVQTQRAIFEALWQGGRPIDELL